MEEEIRFVKCTFCGWVHSYDASVAANADKAWDMANKHAIDCPADPRNERIATLEALLKEAQQALDSVTGIGHKDTSNPKYDGIFINAMEVSKKIRALGGSA